MVKFSFKQLIIYICISYTLLSLVSTILTAVTTQVLMPFQLNQLLMFVWSCIALGSLSLYYCFENWSTLSIVLLQYAVAMGLVFMSVFVIGLFEPLHPDAIKDAFVSFTVPYVFGAILFNVSIHLEVKKMNAQLEKLQL